MFDPVPVPRSSRRSGSPGTVASAIARVSVSERAATSAGSRTRSQSESASSNGVGGHFSRTHSITGRIVREVSSKNDPRPHLRDRAPSTSPWPRRPRLAIGRAGGARLRQDAREDRRRRARGQGPRSAPSCLQREPAARRHRRPGLESRPVIVATTGSPCANASATAIP